MMQVLEVQISTVSIRERTMTKCFSLNDWCNTEQNCLNVADEEGCFATFVKTLSYIGSIDDLLRFHNVQPPAVVNFVKGEKAITPAITPLNIATGDSHIHDVTLCPLTHFQCPGDGYCLPVFVLCNGMYDCPGHEDEAACEQFTCPGFYRCRGSHICLHPDHLCDGFLHCEQQDDERFCHHSCPTNCTCQGLSFHCSSEEVSIENFPDVRYLEASNSGLRPERLWKNTMLVFLALQRCGLTTFCLPELSNLVILDVSDNSFHTVTTDQLKKAMNLKVLLLSSNPLTALFEGNASSVIHNFPAMHILHLSRVVIPNLSAQAVDIFPSLTVLNLSQSGVHRVTGSLPTPQLQTLDVTGCDLHRLPPHWLTSLPKLHSVHTDVPTLCCPQNLPGGFNLKHCLSPSSLFSSCHSLLGSAILRAMTVILAAVAVLGNSLNLFMVLHRANLIASDGTIVFVSQLCVSNLVTGVHLSGVCVADQVYQGEYLWVDRWWRHSPWCSLCSFLYLLSVQVSALILVCLTVAHCVHLVRPDIQVWGRRQVVTSSILCWGTGLVLTITPHLSQWTLQHQTSLCVPLPLTHTPGALHNASHVLIVVNMLLMTVTMTGQLYIYIIICTNPIVFVVNSQKSVQLDAARRTMNISVTNACGWFLVAVLVVLLPTQRSMPDEIRSAVTAFVLPVNMALNPVLHVMNVALEQRRHTQTRRVLQRLDSKVKVM